MSVALSPRAVLIRSAILDVLREATERMSTADISRIVVDRIDDGRVGLAISRQEVGQQVKALAALEEVDRHHGGESEEARSRFGGSTYTRASRGTVTWSIKITC
jgi:hypothetical protein